jgi:ubiquinone/menaquinone biosynthesis C-methylase UbiE
MRSKYFTDQLRQKIYSVAQVQPGKLAADLGAGTGFISEGLLQRGLRVIAVDQSEAMLVEMRRKLGERPEVGYRLGEAESLPIEDEEVDYSFANMYLHHVEDPGLAIREMARILKPGGRLVVTDMDEHHFDFLREEHHDRWMGFRREDIQRWLEEAGLLEVVLDCVGENCCAESETGDQSASVSLFIASGLKGIS